MPADQPVIVIKKKKGGHGGHHGGAWKVAYADFVTAMMAFFLVMWLVTQSKDVKQAVGGYFRDPGVFDYQKSKGILPGGTPGAEPGQAPQAVAPKDAASVAQEPALLAAAADHIKQQLMTGRDFATLPDQ